MKIKNLYEYEYHYRKAYIKFFVRQFITNLKFVCVSRTKVFKQIRNCFDISTVNI